MTFGVGVVDRGLLSLWGRSGDSFDLLSRRGGPENTLAESFGFHTCGEFLNHK